MGPSGLKNRQGLSIIAKTGYFLDRDDSPYADVKDPAWEDALWSKRHEFNEFMEAKLSGTRISRSNYICGGCFAVSAEAFTRVAFDYRNCTPGLPKYSVLPGVIVFGTIAGLLLLEPHYSGIVIIGVLTVIMLYIGGMKTKYLIVGGIALGAIILLLAVTGGLSYAMSRMDGWGQALSAERGTELWDQTWQTRNSLYAIGSGGLWGLGLGQSRQKFLYLPEPQNDFIFAIVVEELGLIGAAIILLIFALLVWRGITLSLRSKDKFGKLLGIGLTSQIGIQVVLNILVITDWLPNTGISLPFFSYGGSSLIMLLAQMGIVLSISRTANIERT